MVRSIELDDYVYEHDIKNQDDNIFDFWPVLAITVHIVIALTILTALVYGLIVFIVNNIGLETFIYVLSGALICAAILIEIFSQSYILWFIIKRLNNNKKILLAVFVWIISVLVTIYFTVLIGLFFVVYVGNHM